MLANINHIKRVFVNNVAEVWYSSEKAVAVLCSKLINIKSFRTLTSNASHSVVSQD